MIHSMTGYGVATRQAAFTDHSGAPCDNVATVSVEFRTVNSRFLDLLFRAPEECRAFEPALREMLMSALSRGKLECRINLQRQEAAGDVAALNVGVLQQLATLEQEVARHLPAAGSLRMGEVLRWPGVLAEPELTQDALREAVTAGAKEALQQLLESRRREGEALKAMLLERVDAMLSIVEDLVPMVPNLIQQHQDKLTERLREAFGLAAPDGTPALTRDELTERIRQEATVYGIRIDIAEELSRLQAHLRETRHILEKGGQIGKRLDFMMQELNREANTLGSKAAAKELADASMELKLLIEQMREQVQNLE
ncbi:YicC/YloC family endoribonuclease [Ralstonia pseudosolanacearum]|uniref:YicC/YloC family endoribonuclease n=1 Tax=Ralstonia pseudosolanacearum TaxID=1310165 RepID=UPI002676A68F|nr:YicC/YloC family endoribonuclease [Ralstonia pseudosolanacearum]MDO3525339.1 YicC/YloC family endoribonuclease [Ralstonia pseudosolanacearum]MDO3530463.1 YicC/YloC family endoribonuclease [Ralstonia pseudosolanacearum]